MPSAREYSARRVRGKNSSHVSWLLNHLCRGLRCDLHACMQRAHSHVCSCPLCLCPWKCCPRPPAVVSLCRSCFDDRVQHCSLLLPVTGDTLQWSGLECAGTCLRVLVNSLVILGCPCVCSVTAFWHTATGCAHAHTHTQRSGAIDSGLCHAGGSTLCPCRGHESRLTGTRSAWMRYICTSSASFDTHCLDAILVYLWWLFKSGVLWCLYMHTHKHLHTTVHVDMPNLSESYTNIQCGRPTHKNVTM